MATIPCKPRPLVRLLKLAAIVPLVLASEQVFGKTLVETFLLF